MENQEYNVQQGNAQNGNGKKKNGCLIGCLVVVAIAFWGGVASCIAGIVKRGYC